MNTKIEEAKNIILDKLKKAGVKVKKIILLEKDIKDKEVVTPFNLVVVANKKIDFNDKYDLIDDIDLEFIEKGIPCVVYITSDQEYRYNKNDVGHLLLYEAEQNGVEI